MNYITIKEAVEKTGVSDKTIRRLLDKKESKAFIDEKDKRKLIDVNYLFSVYPPKNNVPIQSSQNIDIVQEKHIDSEKQQLIIELARVNELVDRQRWEMEILRETIADKRAEVKNLSKVINLLPAPKEVATLKEVATKEEKKKSWWPFTLS
jgi:hypothetical protein